MSDCMGMTPVEELECILEDIAKIKAQIDAAQAEQVLTGKYADPIWFAKANAALRFKGSRHQQLQRIVAEQRRIERLDRQREFEHCFVNAARLILDKETFASVMHRACAESGMQI